MHPGAHAATIPDHPAIVMEPTGEVVTYRQLAERSNRLAQHMWAEGLRPGDHVAVMMENCPRYFEVYWATVSSGLYLTPISRHLTADEAAYIVEDCDARLLITSAALGDVAEEVAARVPACPLRLMADGVRPGYASYEDAVADRPVEPLAEQPLGDVLFYSSGTTGRPKGIKRPLSGRTVDQHPWGRLYGGMFSMGGDAVYLSTGPLYHAAALGFASAVHCLGGTVVVLDRFDALQALRAIDRHRVTHSQWVPTMFVRMLRLPEADRAGVDLSSHRVAIHGAAPCPVEVKHQVIAWWGPIVQEYYGGTEMSGLTMIDSEQWLAHEGSVGRPIFGEIHICDEDHRELPVGEDGLIYFGRDEMPFAYHKDAEKTASAQHPEHPAWSTFGDIGHVDADGYLYLTDRKSFMIISGGVNIYPAESENVLAAHPKVMDAAVIGVPDAEFGEAVKAIVQPVAGVAPTPELAQELVDHCRDRLAHYKCPRSVDFVTDLPRLPTGKLAKRVLRAPYWAEAGS